MGQVVLHGSLGSHPKTPAARTPVLLAQTSTSTQDAALFAQMMSLANDGRFVTVLRELDVLPVLPAAPP